MSDSLPTAQRGLLTSKWGPLPVWAWALAGLAAAWLYAKWRDSQAAAADAAAGATGAAGEEVAPQLLIENNMPASTSTPAAPSAPVPVTTAPAPATPPGTSPSPPTNARATPTAPRPVAPSGARQPITYHVVHGDTLSAIAARYHVKGGWQALWEYNTTPGRRPAATIATLRRRGPNMLYSGETILIPQ